MGLLEDIWAFIGNNPVVGIVSFFFAILGFATSILKIYEFVQGRRKAKQEKLVFEYAKKQIETEGKLTQLEQEKMSISRSIKRKRQEVKKLEAQKVEFITSLEAQPIFIELRMMEMRRETLSKEIQQKYTELKEIEEKLGTQPSIPLEVRKAVEARIVKPYAISGRKEQIKSYMILLSYFYGFARIWLDAMRISTSLLDFIFSVTSLVLVIQYFALTFELKRYTGLKYVSYLMPLPPHEGSIWIAIGVWRKNRVSSLANLFLSSRDSRNVQGYRYHIVNPERITGKALLIHKPASITAERSDS